MTVESQNRALLILSYSIVIGLVLTNLTNSFFWDTVQLGSEHATFYFTTHFSQLLLPDAIDSGHIPGFGMYIALIWKLFGRNLISSHLAMLPFSIGIVWQLNKLCIRFVPRHYTGLALLLVLLDSSLLSQITLVSPDIPLVFFFLLSVNAVFNNKKYQLALSVFFLFLISMRGMMLSICLLCLDLYCNISFAKNIKQISLAILKRSLLYIPAFILFVSYNSYHFFVKGWIGYHKDSPWANCFERVDFKGFLYNIGVLGWRILDFGRVGIWMVFFILILFFRKKIIVTKQLQLLAGFTVCLIVLLPMNMLWAKNLLAHRYLIPIYLTFALLCVVILFSSNASRKIKLLLSTLWGIALLTGNLWIYPPKVSKGWDSTLAHLPYFKLRREAIHYLDDKKIDFKEVGTFFPNIATLDLIDLNNDPRNFNAFTDENNYVFYSNIYNIDDETYNKINKYKVLKRFESKISGVYVILYKKP